MDRYLEPRNESSRPALVVGTMNFGKRTPEPESHRIVQRALERGLDFPSNASGHGGKTAFFRRRISADDTQQSRKHPRAHGPPQGTQ